MIRIVSGGTQGSKVYREDGSEIKGIVGIEIMPIRPNGIITAKIELRAEIDIVADSITDSAEADKDDIGA